MRSQIPLFALTLLLGLGSCGSVEVPRTRSYTLQPAAPTVQGATSRATLRVGQFRLDPHLLGEQLQVRVDAHSLESFEYHVWAAPLDSLIGEAIYGALLRSDIFADVITLGERREAGLVLGGQVLAFELVEDADGAAAWAWIAFELRREADAALVAREVLQRRIDCDTHDLETAVAALDQGLASTLQDFLRNAEERGVLRIRSTTRELPAIRAISSPPK
jgi:ABC-type uncharacterized transport system auxiliary subunit